MNRREYRPEDFRDDSSGVIVWLVATIYGVAIGVSGTLFVQWVLS